MAGRETRLIHSGMMWKPKRIEEYSLTNTGTNMHKLETQCPEGYYHLKYKGNPSLVYIAMIAILVIEALVYNLLFHRSVVWN